MRREVLKVWRFGGGGRVGAFGRPTTRLDVVILWSFPFAPPLQAPSAPAKKLLLTELLLLPSQQPSKGVLCSEARYFWAVRMITPRQWVDLPGNAV